MSRSNSPGKSLLAVADGPLVALPVKVRELQRALWAAAKQSSGRRFHALYDRICRGDVLWEAWERVRRTGVRPGWIGSPWSRWRITVWTACCASCAVTFYRVGIVRRRPGAWRSRNHEVVSGRWGFPRCETGWPRQAAKIVLEPIFEADFLSCSYGFRPKRSATQAMERLRVGFIEGDTLCGGVRYRQFLRRDRP